MNPAHPSSHGLLIAFAWPPLDRLTTYPCLQATISLLQSGAGGPDRPASGPALRQVCASATHAEQAVNGKRM